MANSFVAGALLGHVYTLDDGTRVRVRMARSSDLRAIRDLLERAGTGARKLSAERFVCFDPREEYVLCVTALIDGQEILLGLGVIQLDHGEAAPELVLVDEEARRDVRPLLASALSDTARAISRSRAA